MKINITHLLDPQRQTVLIPIAGEKMLQDALPVIKSETAIPVDLLLNDFNGDQGEFHILYGKERRYILIGLGDEPDCATICKSFRQFSYKHKVKLDPKIAISYLYNNFPEAFGKVLDFTINGLLLGSYNIGRFKTEESKSHPLTEDDALIEIIVEPEHKNVAKKAIDLGRSISETQMSIFDLVNAPSNKKTPSVLAKWALSSGEKYGYTVRVLDKKQIVKTGLHALLAVNRGSEHPPVFIIMEYKGQGAKTNKTVGLVGKGVTFDTGGLSIKPSSSMHYMKSDMGGAAAVFGAVELAAKQKLPVNLIGIVPVTDNSVDANSIKPSDVIESYSGKTIEVIDTDAEGRLILADGIAYVLKNYQPDILIDIATLTGSTVRTFGYHTAALFTNDDELADRLYAVSQETGERVWRLPMWDVYKDDIKSDVADIKNFSGRPIAGAISAAKFLEFFTNNHSAWAHLDIAGVAFSDSEFANQKSATSFGVRLLMEFIKSEINRSATISQEQL